MTDAQAAQVKELRLKGMGYQVIAEVLGLSRDIVRNHCKAKGMGGYAGAATRNLQEQEMHSGICMGRKKPFSLWSFICLSGKKSVRRDDYVWKKVRKSVDYSI